MRLTLWVLVPCAVAILAPAGGSQLEDVPSQQAYLKASNTGTADAFGGAAAMSGDTLVIGARLEDGAATGVNGSQDPGTATNSGAVYVFVRDGAGWAQQAYVKASNTGAEDSFGASVSISGNTLVVGAPDEGSSATGVDGDQSNNAAVRSGAAYVFVRSGGAWTQQAYLKASNADSGDRFGSTVAVSGDTIVVGSVGEDSGATGVDGLQDDESAPVSGAAYVFVRSGGSWSQQAYLKASNSEASDRFGFSVAASGDTVVVGSDSEDSSATGVNGAQDSNGASRSGAAYVFVRNGTSWTQQAYLKASNTGQNDRFGNAVSVWGDTVVVAAEGESSSATGVDGDQASNAAAFSGAAYVFVRSGTGWSQQAYLKASNTETNDSFGRSSSLSGDTLVLGAYDEGSSATGVNGDQSDDSLVVAGAAYLFVRSGASWSQHAYLKASNTGSNQFFGESAAVSGDSVVIGAPGEASKATGVDGDSGDTSAMGSGAAYVFDLGLDAWADLGSGLAGLGGVPLLVGSGALSAGSSNQLDLTLARPSSPATLVFGFALLAAPFKGGTLVPMPLLLLPLTTTAAGSVSLPFSWPPTLPRLTPLLFQCWVVDPAAPAGLSASNGLLGVSS
jgi:trimeric autotransporter adhesin